MKYAFKNKRKAAAYGFFMCIVFLLVVCIGAGGKQTEVRMTDAEYVDYEIPEHDGDVLVDSLSIASVAGSRTEADGTEEQTTSGGAAAVTSDDISELDNADTYFEEARATLNMDRNQIISMLADVIAETDSTTEKENAAQQKLKIIDYMEKEKVIESLIEAKGLPETFVIITDNAVNVTVKKQSLSQADVAKIFDIIMRETGRNADQIIIQSK